MKPPEDFDSIDELIREGKEGVCSYLIARGALGQPEYEPSAYFERALDLLHDAPDSEKEYRVRDQWGWYLGSIGNFKAAIDQFQQAVTLKPGQFHTQFNLAQMRHLLAEHSSEEEKPNLYSLASQEYATLAGQVSYFSLRRYSLRLKAIQDSFRACQKRAGS
ncbi:MAG: hypothetical protein QT02_C0001G0051 [archaeon GW2011_AR9]|nr:MAG: hypothetical protein QT02_C0001G0051 [archaeon GW2011_AR9]MBS3120240.1 hypothetical protein [Candidatus Woesearchaeota archaeon]HIH12670.1 hypothetical protein [Candidatus Woesearchaeota archaeon]